MKKEIRGGRRWREVCQSISDDPSRTYRGLSGKKLRFGAQYIELPSNILEFGGFIIKLTLLSWHHGREVGVM
jgi:hypothetical protein